MGIIEEKRKFKREVEQKHPTNPKINNSETKKFNIDKETIKGQQNKK
tara:strand:+ start:583 stop:723 length:141 start_codon:yes stop_codon:yes gene_type:complete